MKVVIPGLSESQCAKFEQYLTLLIKWNAVHNLTSVREPAEIITRHFHDSLGVLPYLSPIMSTNDGCVVGGGLSPVTRVLDLGTGAGFPGLPLAIARPDMEWVLVDAVGKKISFCQEVIRSCGLTNARAVHGRAEDSKMQSELGKFDIVISRATWALKDYLPQTLPYLLGPGAQVWAMKGPGYEAEIIALGDGANKFLPPKIYDYDVGGEIGKKFKLIKYCAK